MNGGCYCKQDGHLTVHCQLSGLRHSDMSEGKTFQTERVRNTKAKTKFMYSKEQLGSRCAQSRVNKGEKMKLRDE